MDYELKGKVAIITGGTSGIGLETARIFADGGAKVTITGRDETKLENVVEELRNSGGEILGLRADLNDLGELDRALEETENRLGPVDILINNAGTSHPGAFFETGPEDWMKVIQSRLIGPLYLTQKTLARMEARGRGAVVMMAAVIHKEPIAENVMAGTAGSGLLGMTKSLARLMAPKGVRVNAVLLGQFDTPTLRRGLKTFARLAGVSEDEAGKIRAAQNPTGRFGDPKEAAHLAAFLSSDAASYMTGSIVPVDGGRSQAI
jgi:NAD(P)-dependent dehydrogenase (short-subunit alcohol dehydrogenase family)